MPFIRPTESYERTGQYSNGTTFVEGLVPFKGRWYLYYGTADSRVGVAGWGAPRRPGRPCGRSRVSRRFSAPPGEARLLGARGGAGGPRHQGPGFPVGRRGG